MPTQHTLVLAVLLLVGQNSSPEERPGWHLRRCTFHEDQPGISVTLIVSDQRVRSVEINGRPLDQLPYGLPFSVAATRCAELKVGTMAREHVELLRLRPGEIVRIYEGAARVQTTTCLDIATMRVGTVCVSGALGVSHGGTYTGFVGSNEKYFEDPSHCRPRRLSVSPDGLALISQYGTETSSCSHGVVFSIQHASGPPYLEALREFEGRAAWRNDQPFCSIAQLRTHDVESNLVLSNSGGLSDEDCCHVGDVRIPRCQVIRQERDWKPRSGARAQGAVPATIEGD